MTAVASSWAAHSWVPLGLAGQVGQDISSLMGSTDAFPHQVHLAWWFLQMLLVPGCLGFEPQRSRRYFGLPGV